MAKPSAAPGGGGVWLAQRPPGHWASQTKGRAWGQGPWSGLWGRFAPCRRPPGPQGFPHAFGGPPQSYPQREILKPFVNNF